MHLGHRHQMLRRKGKIVSPAPKWAASRLDTLAYFVAFAGMAVALDQVRLVWINQNASGVSLLTWSFFTVSSCVWFAYGRVHGDKVLMITNALWVLVNGSVALGVMIYGV